MTAKPIGSSGIPNQGERKNMGIAILKYRSNNGPQLEAYYAARIHTPFIFEESAGD